MRVTIVGKTASTITFNTLGIVLRGLASAIHIDIKNDDQRRELIGLKNAGLINVIIEEAPEDVKPVIIAPLTPVKENQTTEVPDSKVEDNKVEDSDEDSDVEDSPSNKDEKVEPPAKKQRGRPKGTKKEKANEVQKPNTIKRVALKQDNNESPETSEKPEKTDVVVMTTSGPFKTKMPRTMSPEISDSDLTKASIDALSQLEEEEKRDNKDPVFIDEEKLDRSEKMGEKAIIAMGANKTLSVNMQNSVLPESDAVKLIETKDQEIIKNENSKAYDAFIEKMTSPDPSNNDTGIDSDDLDFLEI